jgi:hypothetical protein
MNNHQVDYLDDESYQDSTFGYRLLEIELEHLYGFDVNTTHDDWRYEGRI